MRLYQIAAEGQVPRFAGTMAESRALRQRIIGESGLRKNQVQIEEIEVPTTKQPLIAYLNKLMEQGHGSQS